MTVSETCLKGAYVALEPLMHSHVDALQSAVRDGELWQLWYASVPSPDEMARLFRDHSQAIANTLAIAKACRFSLGADAPVSSGA